jgi:hypothetical protein
VAYRIIVTGFVYKWKKIPTKVSESADKLGLNENRKGLSSFAFLSIHRTLAT